MKKFFEPASVAVIGASATEGKIGYGIVRNLKNFSGSVYPINPNEESILGFDCYKSVLKVPVNIDLGVIAVPAKIVPKVLIECGRKKIKNVIIISAGFSEIGENKLENELIKISKKYKIRVMGPNNFGSVNPYNGLDTSFNFTMPDKGSVAFISQSGAIWAALSSWSLGKIGFSKFGSLGNMIDVDFADLIDYFNKDEMTKVIICYVEKIKDGKHFMDVCSKSKKPVIVIKAGKSEAGAKAALSHTGSLAGSYEIYSAAFKQCGVVLAETITEAFDKALFLSRQKLVGKGTVIITNGGGVGVLMTDHCVDNGLDVVSLPKSFFSGLKIPKICSKNNPIDVVGDADWDRYKLVFDRLRKFPKSYDNVTVIILENTRLNIEKTAFEILDFMEKSGKAVVCCFMGGDKLERAGNVLSKKGIPCFFEAERCANVLR